MFTTKQEADLAASSLGVRTVRPWDQLELGPFTVTAVPALDGLGDPQVSWVVEADGKRLLHGGDTAFHGYLGSSPGGPGRSTSPRCRSTGRS